MRNRSRSRKIPAQRRTGYNQGHVLKAFPLMAGMLLMLGAGSVIAEPRYVIDELTITLRSGRSNQHNILKLLHSGARVEVHEEVVENGHAYSRVRADGLEGWVLSQYLVAEPIARDRLAAAEQRLQQSREDNRRLQQQLRQVKSELAELHNQRTALDNRAKQLGNQLDNLKQVAARPVEVEQQNRQLHKELAGIQRDHALLRQQHALLTHAKQRDWFIAGAGVVIASMIFGILLTRIRWRRRNGWGDL